MKFPSSNSLIKIWCIATILWFGYIAYLWIKVMNGLEISIANYSTKDMIFGVAAAFLLPPIGLATILYLTYKVAGFSKKSKHR